MVGRLRLGLVRDHGRARPGGAGGHHLSGCRRPLALLADPKAPPPEPYVAHFLVPAARWWDDVVRTCSTIRLACHLEHVEAWAAAAGERVGAVVDLPTMWRLGTVWYGDRLHDDHRRRTPEEAAAVLAELGLTGPFWDMGAPAGRDRTGRPRRRGRPAATLSDANGPRPNLPAGARA